MCILTFTEPLQLTMYVHERKALEAYKELTGKSYNYIVDKAIKAFILDNTTYDIPKPDLVNKEWKRLAVRLSVETQSLLKEYCEANKEKMSPTVVKAVMKYIIKSL